MATGVGLFLPNCIEYLYCWFGLSLLGAISVPINTAYKRDETAYLLNDAGAAALVTDPSLAETAAAAADLAPGVRHRLLRGDAPPPAGWRRFADEFAAAAEPSAAALPDGPPVTPDDVSMLVYTSGTTGNPKGVQVTHRMYVAGRAGVSPTGRRPRRKTASLPACPTTTPTPSITPRWGRWPPAPRWW